MGQCKGKGDIDKKRPAQIMSITIGMVASTEGLSAIAEQVFCRKASAILGVEKQERERVGGAVRLLLDSQRWLFQGLAGFWTPKNSGDC